MDNYIKKIKAIDKGYTITAITEKDKYSIVTQNEEIMNFYVELLIIVKNHRLLFLNLLTFNNVPEEVLIEFMMSNKYILLAIGYEHSMYEHNMYNRIHQAINEINKVELIVLFIHFMKSILKDNCLPVVSVTATYSNKNIYIKQVI